MKYIISSSKVDKLYCHRLRYYKNVAEAGKSPIVERQEEWVCTKAKTRLKQYVEERIERLCIMHEKDDFFRFFEPIEKQLQGEHW